MSGEFTGCKLAYILKDQVLVYKRDDLPAIPFPGLWDFPGGAREGDESAEACVLRELQEEFAIALPSSRLIYKKAVPNYTRDGRAYFFVAHATADEIEAIEFSDEGQFWRMMPIDDFLQHPRVVPGLITRLRAYLASEER